MVVGVVGTRVAGMVEVVAVVVVRQEANGPLQGGESQRRGMCIISIDLVFNGLSVRAARAAFGFGFARMAPLAKNRRRHRISIDFQKPISDTKYRVEEFLFIFFFVLLLFSRR